MNYSSALESIYERAPFQRKKIQAFLADKHEDFYIEANRFVTEYEVYLNEQGLSFAFAIDAYLAMCRDMIVCQVSFMRTGKYPRENQAQAFFEIYDSREVMFGYMVGLGFSQFLWSSHYEMYEHLKSELGRDAHLVNSYLEIGPGHGLFLKYAVQNLNPQSDIQVIDISSTSIEMAKSLLNLDPASKRQHIEFVTEDFLKLKHYKKFDFVVMGEVLEHVDNPASMLQNVTRSLNPGGRAFVSTCINCPMTDHVYQFNSVEEIRELIKNAGLQIKSEKVLPVEDLDFEEIMRRKITVNYSAVCVAIQDTVAI